MLLELSIYFLFVNLYFLLFILKNFKYLDILKIWIMIQRCACNLYYPFTLKYFNLDTGTSVQSCELNLLLLVFDRREFATTIKSETGAMLSLAADLETR